jgi:hypothetical protein
MYDKKLPLINLALNDVEEVIDPNEDLAIYDGDLITEFSEQPSKFAFYGGLYSDAEIKLKEFELTLRTYEAESEQLMRERILSRFGATERITEAKLESEFLRDEEWNKLQQAILKWRRIVGQLEICKESFKQRAQMLWNIGATRRQEMLRLNPNNIEEQS